MYKIRKRVKFWFVWWQPVVCHTECVYVVWRRPIKRRCFSCDPSSRGAGGWAVWWRCPRPLKSWRSRYSSLHHPQKCGECKFCKSGKPNTYVVPFAKLKGKAWCQTAQVGFSINAKPIFQLHGHVYLFPNNSVVSWDSASPKTSCLMRR